MPFLFYCSNKGCGKDTEPQLDLKTNLVYCQDCGGEIKNMSPFAKQNLKSFNQIRKGNADKAAFAVKCNDCNKNVKPNLINDKVYCTVCKVELSLAPSIIHMIKLNWNVIKNQK